MSRFSSLIAVLAVSFLATALAQDGTVSAAIGDISEQEFLEFNYEVIEFNANEANEVNEWAFEESGVGEFRLSDEIGDIFVIQAQNADDFSAPLRDILVSKTNNDDASNEVVVDVIGDSISAGQGHVQTGSYVQGVFHDTNGDAYAVVTVNGSESVAPVAVEAVEGTEATEEN